MFLLLFCKVIVGWCGVVIFVDGCVMYLVCDIGGNVCFVVVVSVGVW